MAAHDTMKALVRETHKTWKQLLEEVPNQDHNAEWTDWCYKLAVSCEKLATGFDSSNSHADKWAGIIDKRLIQCRNILENRRIKRHWEFCIPMKADREGLTMDVAYFQTVCVCDYVRHVVLMTTNDLVEPSTVQLPFNGVVVSNMSPLQLDVSFGSIFHHRRHMNIKELPAIIGALQRRAACFIGEFCLGHTEKMEDFPRRRAQWGCATARLRIAVARQLDVRAEAGSPGDNVLSAWVARTLPKWQSDRFAEAVMRAVYKRDSRPDETGYVTAMREKATVSRAGTTVALLRKTVQALDYDHFMQIAPEDRVSTIAEIRDMIIVLLFSNALLEVDVQFRQEHLVLDSVQETLKPVRERNWKVVELFSGWGLQTPHLDIQTYGTIDHALLAWYDTYFPDNDPLDIRSQPALE